MRSFSASDGVIRSDRDFAPRPRMLDFAALLFDSLFMARVLRAARHRALIDPLAAPARLDPAIVARVGDVDSEGGPVRARQAPGPGAEWVVVTEPGVTCVDAIVDGAIAIAELRAVDAVTVRGRDADESSFAAGVGQTIGLWTGEGVDPDEFSGPDDRRAVGFDELLLVRRSAYDRVARLDTGSAEPCRARAFVRSLKRAGFRVLPAAATAGLVRPLRPLGAWLRAAVARYHSLSPPGRVWPVVIATLVTVCGLRPFVILVRGLTVASAPPSAWSFGLASTACAVVVAQRIAFDRLTDRRSGNAWTLPFGILAASSAAWVCALQRLVGLDSRFVPIVPDQAPDHADGVDYKAVYTERYFDGVDSRFSPCGFRDDARYYDRLLEPLLEVTSGGRALDVGCGYGYLTRRLARHFHTTGIDVSEAAIRRCRATLPDLEFVVHEVEQPFPMSEASFDVVTLTDVLEHLVDPEQMLRNVHRVLTDGGILYVTTPNLNRLRRWLYADADRREHHVSLLPRGELLAVLERCGFQVLRSWTYVSAYMVRGRFDSDLGPETGVICRKVLPR